MMDIAITPELSLMMIFSYFSLALFVLKYGEVRTKLLWVAAWGVLIGFILYQYGFLWGLSLLVVGLIILAYYIARFLSTIFSQL